MTVEREKALQQAAEVQKKIEAGELTGPLAGVPFAIKDNMCTEGTLTTCSSKILENFVPTFSAEAVLNLEKAGAVILGKTNMDEFAMGSTTETSYYGVTKRSQKPGACARRFLRRLCSGSGRRRNALQHWVPIPAVPFDSPHLIAESSA